MSLEESVIGRRNYKITGAREGILSVALSPIGTENVFITSLKACDRFSIS
jgi:hypothetical protein